MIYTWTIKKEYADQRLDFVVSELGSISRSQANKAIRSGQVQLNKITPQKTGVRVQVGDQITYNTQRESSVEEVEKSERAEVEFPNIEIIQDNPDFVVVYKPAGVLVHPTFANEKNTLVDWVLANYPDVKHVGEKPERPGIVHRLDKMTSGLLVIAKTQAMYEHLKEQFKNRDVEKIYFALVYGHLEKDHGIIDFKIGRGNDGKMVARPRTKEITLESLKHVQEGKDAKTEFWVEQTFNHYTYVKVQIHTGRTHQIRVHFFASGHAVVGDELYVHKKSIREETKNLRQMFLHAGHLGFYTREKEFVSFDAPLPDSLQIFLDRLV